MGDAGNFFQGPFHRKSTRRWFAGKGRSRREVQPKQDFFPFRFGKEGPGHEGKESVMLTKNAAAVHPTTRPGMLKRVFQRVVYRSCPRLHPGPQPFNKVGDFALPLARRRQHGDNRKRRHLG
jgi:hypothetical protein